MRPGNVVMQDQMLGLFLITNRTVYLQFSLISSAIMHSKSADSIHERREKRALVFLTSAPTICAIWIAAKPTPPQAEWIRTVCRQSANGPFQRRPRESPFGGDENAHLPGL